MRRAEPMREGIPSTSANSPDFPFEPDWGGRRISRAAVAGIVVIAAGKFHEHARLVPDRPRIMTSRQQHDIVLRKVLLRTIVHNDPERSGKHESHMWQSTTIGLVRN